MWRCFVLALLFDLTLSDERPACQQSDEFDENRLPHVAIVTAYRRAKEHEREQYADIHDKLLDKAINNFLTYSHATGVPVFFLNEHLFRNDIRAHFVLIDAFRHYLNFGYDWVFWTDIDFLFMDHSISLRKIALDAGANGYCAVGSDESFSPGKLMSGTFMVRNSPWTYAMLDAWEFKYYPPVRNHELHTQDAFENMMRTSWRAGVKVLPSAQFMAYGSRARPRDKLFGVHFPGGDKYTLFFKYHTYFATMYNMSSRSQRVEWLVT